VRSIVAVDRTQEDTMDVKKTVATLVLGATLAGGGLTAAAIGLPGLAGAQGDSTSTTAAPDAEAGQPHGGRGRILQGVLSDLVADGTITQAQADAVSEAIAVKAGEVRERRADRRAERAEQLATFIGVTTDELKAELRSGKSLADVAEAHGHTSDELVAAIVAAITTRLDAAVTDGKLTQAQADAVKAAAPARVERLVERPGGHARLGRLGRIGD
jgi:hypothetical protein